MFTWDLLHIATTTALSLIFIAATVKAFEHLNEHDTEKDGVGNGFKRLMCIFASLSAFAISLVWLVGFAARVVLSMVAQ